MENRSFCFCGHSVRAIAFLRPLSRFGNGQVVLMECFGEGPLNTTVTLCHATHSATPSNTPRGEERRRKCGTVVFSGTDLRIRVASWHLERREVVAFEAERREVSNTRFEHCWSVPGRFRSRSSPNQELHRCCFAFAFVGVQLDSLG